jgi:SNF2 family DNA or RNA helicase
MHFKTRPFKHQTQCLKDIGDRPYYALFLEPGLGKTKISIDLIANRKLQHSKYPTLVVCPNTLVDNWVDEVHKHSDLTCTTLTGTKSKRKDKLLGTYDIYIINYEGTRIA